MRRYSEASGRGRLDVDGVRWFAGDPYPTWYRTDEDGVRHVRSPVWGNVPPDVVLDGPSAPWARERVADLLPGEDDTLRLNADRLLWRARDLARQIGDGGADADLAVLAAQLRHVRDAVTAALAVAEATPSAERRLGQ